MNFPVTVDVGPFVFDLATWFWIKVAFWVYVAVGLVVWFFYAKTKLEEENGGRGVEHIAVGLLHGVLWPVYVALALFVAWAS